MFIREPFKAPPGSTTTYEVKYNKGRKPFELKSDATNFARACRGETNGWAEVNMIVSINVETRS